MKPSVVKREALEEWFQRWKAQQSGRYAREADDGTEWHEAPAEDDGVWMRALAAAADGVPRRDMEERFGEGMAARAIAEVERTCMSTSSDDWTDSCGGMHSSPPGCFWRARLSGASTGALDFLPWRSHFCLLGAQASR